MLELKNISFGYTKDKEAIKGIDLELKPNKIYFLMGENGSGKSTLLLLLKGIYSPNSGEILYKNNRTRGINMEIGFLFQDPDVQLIGPDVERDIEFGPFNLGWDMDKIKKNCEEAMRKCSVFHLKNKNPFKLSQGEKRRVALAGILSMEPEIILMDEPTIWLDPYHQGVLKKEVGKLYDEGKTLIISTHDIEFARSFDAEYIFLKEGKIYAQGDKSLLEDEKLMTETKLLYKEIQDE